MKIYCYIYCRKDKHISDQKYQSSVRTDTGKNTKYGAWGPIYKNKQNFINMHNC